MDTAEEVHSAPPDPLADGEGLAAPVPQNPPSALGLSALFGHSFVPLLWGIKFRPPPKKKKRIDATG